MEAVRTSETSVYSKETTRRYITQGTDLYVHVDGLSLRLWTAATTWRIVRPHVIYEYGKSR
jgi:hypothetical protein